MKKLLIFLVALSMVGVAHARKFQSADGSKEIEAQFVRYNPRTGDVTLRMTDGRNMITKSTFFSEEDREFFREEYRKLALKGAVSVRQHDKIDHFQKEKGGLWIDMTKSEWTFTIKNESKVDLKHLDIHYWVVVERYNFGKEDIETSSGEASIIELKAESEEKIAGPTLELIRGAAPKGARDKNHYIHLLNEAAKYDDDKMLGWRVEVYDDDGNLLLADSSGLRVDRILGKDKKDDEDDD